MSEPAEREGPATGEARGTLGTVRNAVLLLGLLTEGPAYQQLTELAERSGLSTPTVHRLLRSLVQADLVEQDSRTSRYSLGPGVTRLAQRYLGRLPILGALAPYLVSLRDTLQATIHVAVLVRETVVYVDRIDASDGGPFRESHRLGDALSTASGRLLAAQAPDDVWLACVAADDALDDPDEWRKEWSIASFLVSDVSSAGGEVAVPVADASGTMMAALSATLPPDADDAAIATMVAHLSRAAAAAGRTLGHG